MTLRNFGLLMVALGLLAGAASFMPENFEVPRWVWMLGIVPLLILSIWKAPTVSLKDFLLHLLAAMVGLSAINGVLFYQIKAAGPFFESKEGLIHVGLYYALVIASVFVFTYTPGWKKVPWAILFFFAFWGMGTKSAQMAPGLLAEITGGLIGGRPSGGKTEPVKYAGLMPTLCVGPLTRADAVRLDNSPVRVPDCQLRDVQYSGDVTFHCANGPKTTGQPGKLVDWPPGCYVKYVSAAKAGETVFFWADFEELRTPRWVR